MMERIVRRDDHHSLHSGQEQQEVSLVSLPEAKLGTPLARSIYDQNGVLLIAHGARLTEELRRQLLLRGILDVPLLVPVRAHRPHKPMLNPNDATRKAIWDTEINQHLQREIEGKLTLVNNLGPPARLQLDHLGQKFYDPDHRRELVHLHTTAIRILQSQMTQVHQGVQIDARFLERLAIYYLEHLLRDMDCCLTVNIPSSPRTQLAEHCIRLALLSMATAIHLGMTDRNVSRIGVTAMVHDWGWLRIHKALWFRTTHLEPLDEVEVKRHPNHTSVFLERMWGLPALVGRISHQVHEKLDGSGYPRGDRDRHIHQFARILHVANEYLRRLVLIWDSPRNPYDAMENLLRQGSEGRIDPLVFRGFLRTLSLFPLGSYVSLSDGSIARVLRANGDFYTAPIVQRVVKEEPGTRKRIEYQDQSAIVDLHQSNIKVVKALPMPRTTPQPIPTPHFATQSAVAALDKLVAADEEAAN